MTTLTIHDILDDTDIEFAARTFNAAFHNPALWDRMTDDARAVHTEATRAAMGTVGPATAARTLRATAAALLETRREDLDPAPPHAAWDARGIAAWLDRLADQLADGHLAAEH